MRAPIGGARHPFPTGMTVNSFAEPMPPFIGTNVIGVPFYWRGRNSVGRGG